MSAEAGSDQLDHGGNGRRNEAFGDDQVGVVLGMGVQDSAPT